MKRRSTLDLKCLVCTVALTGLAHSAEFTWTNLTSNGSLGTTQGYTWATASNWNTTPTFDSTSILNFINGPSGAITIYGGAATQTVNKMVFDSLSSWRINSANTTINFAGTDPTLDVESGTLRLEIKLSGSGGLTKTGAGSVFSNLQSASAGFTGPYTIAEGLVTMGNNYGLGDQKTVNIQTGGGLNLNGQFAGSANITGGVTVTRNYTFNIEGTGANSLGAIYNSGGNITGGLSGIHTLTLTDDASVGGTGRFDIAASSGSISGGNHVLSKIGSNEIWVRGAATDIQYAVKEGSLVVSDSALALGGSGGLVSVSNGAKLASNGTLTIATPMSLDAGSTLENQAGTAAWTGNVSLGTVGNATVTGAVNNNTTMSGLISGQGGLTKTGANTLTFSNANTYSGHTLITQGILSLAAGSSISDSSTVTVRSGATLNVIALNEGFVVPAGQILDGAGTIDGDATIRGTHSPGESPGVETFTRDLAYGSTSVLIWELLADTTSGRGTSWDGVTVGGDLSISSGATFAITLGGAGGTTDFNDAFWDTVQTWSVFNVTGSISGGFDNITVSTDSLGQSPPSQGGFSFSGGNLVWSPVPEPCSAILGSLSSLVLLRRRRR